MYLRTHGATVEMTDDPERAAFRQSNGIGDEATLCGIINKITQAVALPINLGSCHVRIGSSIGMAVYPDHGDDPASLLTHADKAMYSAKRKRCDKALSSQT